MMNCDAPPPKVRAIEQRPHGVRGFTLIEVLVAIAVFSVISMMAFQGLSTTLRVQDRVERGAERLRQEQLIWTLLMRDFINMSRREVRAEDKIEPAFQVSSEDCSLEIRFTRAGLPINDINRSGLQRIAYCWHNDLLLRRVWPALDRSIDSEPVESVLLQDVSNFYAYTCYAKDCTEGEIDSQAHGGDLPIFIEVFIEFSREDEEIVDDEIKQRFWIAGGVRQAS